MNREPNHVGRVLFIGRDHPLYEQELDLRERVIHAPLNQTMEDFDKEFPGFEDRFEHYVAVVEHPKGRRVIGCVCLLPDFPERGSGKLMQMAVDPQRQREGVGSELVAHVERRAFGELGLRELWCHALKSAEGFYRRMGWEPAGEVFIEAGVPHQKMIFKP